MLLKKESENARKMDFLSLGTLSFIYQHTISTTNSIQAHLEALQVETLRHSELIHHPARNKRNALIT